MLALVGNNSKDKALSALRLDADLYILTASHGVIETFKETGHNVRTESQPFSHMLGKAYLYLGTSPARYEYLRALASKNSKCTPPRISRRVKRDSRKIVGIFP